MPGTHQKKSSSGGTSRGRSRSRAGDKTAATGHAAEPLIDHDAIRRWAEAREAVPSRVCGTGDEEDVGMIRLDFPGFSGEGKLEPIEWEEWFAKFDERNLALLVQGESHGKKSNFNKLVSRDSVRESGRDH